MSEKDYVLGTDQEELLRLRRQHELWATQARQLWERAGMGRRDKILDLGCGPGFTTMELARFVGSQAQITAVDASSRFLAYLNSRAEAEVPHVKIQTQQTFLEKMDLPTKDFDAAYCRWLMIFVPDVVGALKAVHRHLKPGATFALQEYVAYETMQLCPEVPIMEKVLKAIFKSWRDEGGDPNRGRELPDLLEKNGFRVRELHPVSRIARPNDPLWNWPSTFLLNFTPKLVQKGLLTQAEHEDFVRALKETSENPGGFFLAPTMIDIVAERI